MPETQIVVGCKVNVLKNLGAPNYRQAEILSIRNSPTLYYVHYTEFNKRLDEWVTPDRLDLSTLQPPKKAATPAPKRKKGDVEDDEKERLRQGGSISISEVSRVKNLNFIVMGKHRIEAWYFSPYPAELAHKDMVFICEHCLYWFGEEDRFARHREKCSLLHPPGMEIYRKDGHSFFEIDGRKQRTWCRNLSLLSKCFLDHKTLYYDVDPFLFYVMTKNDKFGYHVIGYFSKEKASEQNYNVACILTLPQYQRMGYGRYLIQFSYELSKIEGKIGSPEKPLSDLGLLSYRAYWADSLVEILQDQQREITIDEISQLTSFSTQDILHTLQSIEALKYYKGQHVICISKKMIESYEKNKSKCRRVDPAYIQWKPPVFSALANQLV